MPREMIQVALGISAMQKDDCVGLSCVFDAVWNVKTKTTFEQCFDFQLSEERFRTPCGGWHWVSCNTWKPCSSRVGG